MRARHKKKMLAKMDWHSSRRLYYRLRKGNMEKLWYQRQSMWRDGERVYTWENSSPAMRDKIIEENWGYNVEMIDWWDTIEDEARDLGIEITSFDDYRCEGKLTCTAMDCIEKIMAEHGESCDTYQTAAEYKALLLADHIKRRCLDDEYWEDEDEDLAAQFLKAILKDYRRMLTAEYEYLTSSECLEERFKNDDYEFDSDGRIL